MSPSTKAAPSSGAAETKRRFRLILSWHLFLSIALFYLLNYLFIFFEYRLATLEAGAAFRLPPECDTGRDNINYSIFVAGRGV